MKYKLPPGTHDILPSEIPLWHHLEKTAHEVFQTYGYQEIRTPIFEYTSLFARSLGESSDIVEKEMYTFSANKSEESLTLRPELTAPVVRAYLEHHLNREKKFQKLYYIGPLFRHERPQKGRYRQFHQIGLEALGCYDYLVDIEIIDVTIRLFELLGIKQAQLVINSIGCPQCRPIYQNALKNNLSTIKTKLCSDCQRRFQTNILRILDCKNKTCYEITSQIPPIQTFLCKQCRNHFEQLISGLKEFDISYKIDSHLVRGFDYYTKTIFEIRHSALGSQNALCGGGRYDNLIEEFGGLPTGAVGCAIGMERVILALKAEIKNNSQVFACPPLKVFLALVEPELKMEGAKFLKELRRKGISADMDFETRSLKGQLRLANKLKVPYVIILGPEELAQGVVKLKDMSSGKEEVLKKEEVYEKISSG